jgi:hypothetical protein
VLCPCSRVRFLLPGGRGSGPRVAAGRARGSTGRGWGGFPPFRPPGWGGGSVETGREDGDLRFPGEGVLGRSGMPEFRACFLFPLGVPLAAGDAEGVEAAADSRAAAAASSDEVAVTCVVVMDRTAWRQAAVKDSSPGRRRRVTRRPRPGQLLGRTTAPRETAPGPVLPAAAPVAERALPRLRQPAAARRPAILLAYL